MPPTYRVRDWGTHFENNRTRELKELRFVILPNKHDGDGYTELLDHANGAAHYGAWCAIVQVASKGQHPAGGCGNPAGCCECRGILLREGARPHNPDTLSRLTRIPAAVFAEVLPRLVNIGWMDSDQVETQENQKDNEIPQGGAVSRPSQSRRGVRKGAASIEQNRTEENRTEEKREPSAHAGLVKFLELKIGVIANPGKQGKAIKWLLEHGYEAEQCQRCYEYLAAETWRTNTVDWVTVQSQIGAWLVKGKTDGTNQQRNGYATASEKRARNFSNRLAIVAELRGEGGGDHNEGNDGERIPARG